MSLNVGSAYAACLAAGDREYIADVTHGLQEIGRLVYSLADAAGASEEQITAIVSSITHLQADKLPAFLVELQQLEALVKDRSRLQ